MDEYNKGRSAVLDDELDLEPLRSVPVPPKKKKHRIEREMTSDEEEEANVPLGMTPLTTVKTAKPDPSDGEGDKPPKAKRSKKPKKDDVDFTFHALSQANAFYTDAVRTNIPSYP